MVHSAGLQDRNGAALVLERILTRFPWLDLVWADAGYDAYQVKAAVAEVPVLRMEIVRRNADQKGFEVQPRRRAEPARGPRPRDGVDGGGGRAHFFWFGRNRRLLFY